MKEVFAWVLEAKYDVRKSDVSWSFAAEVLHVSGAVSVVAFAGSRVFSACVNISLRRTR